MSISEWRSTRTQPRGPSDPLTYYPPDIDNGDTLCGSRDDDVSWTDENCIEDPWEGERNKDAFRRFHALKELLATEVGYCTDLRFLLLFVIFVPPTTKSRLTVHFRVYLRNLPTSTGVSMRK